MQTTVSSDWVESVYKFTKFSSVSTWGYLLSSASDVSRETAAVTEDDNFIRESEIISSHQLSTLSPQQKTEQINFEFSEDYRENDIREGTFLSQCSIDLIGRKPHTEPRVALFCMFHVWVYAGSRQQASLLRLFVNICRGIKSQASGWKGRRQKNKVSPRGSNILWKITEPWHLFFISPSNLCLWCLMAPAYVNPLCWHCFFFLSPGFLCIHQGLNGSFPQSITRRRRSWNTRR